MQPATPRDVMSDSNCRITISKRKFNVLKSVSGGSGSLSNETRENFWQSRARGENATSH
jgi:hypothetical protein